MYCHTLILGAQVERQSSTVTSPFTVPAGSCWDRPVWSGTLVGICGFFTKAGLLDTVDAAGACARG